MLRFEVKQLLERPQNFFRTKAVLHHWLRHPLLVVVGA